MEQSSLDEEREERISNQIIVDAYGPEEQALGWWCYLDQTLQFPFRAKCIAERVISPLRPGDGVKVEGMAPEDECEREMFVMTRWKGRTLGVPLAQLAGVAVDEQTEQGIGDWHYWVGSEYELG